MGNILTQTGGSGATGDLTNMIGNARLAVLCGGSDGYVSTTAVADVIADAEAEVLSILGPGYDVSSSSAVLTKAIVKTHAKQVALYYAYARHPEFRNERGDVITTPQYERAIKSLTDMRKGERDMGDESSTSKSALVGGTVNASIKKFIVESDESGDGPTGGF